MTCMSCYREFRNRSGLIGGMCKSCRSDSDELGENRIEIHDDLRSSAEDHDRQYNGGSGDWDDVSYD